MKRFISCIFMMIMIMVPMKAKAFCSVFDYEEPEKHAYLLKFNYEMKYTEEKDVYYEITISNLADDIAIYEGQTVYSYGHDKDNPSVVTLDTHYPNGSTVTLDVKIFDEDNSCAGLSVMQKEIKLPKYNIYADKEACFGYENFPMCQKYYSGEIESEEYFEEKLEEYKASLLPKEEPKEEENPFFDWYLENKSMTIPITIGIILLVAGIIIMRMIAHKKRVKIDL